MAGAAGAQSANGGFGRSSSETDVDTLTKEGLLDFLLQSRPHSPHNPHSPLGRSASARRYRHLTAADRSLRGYLELLSGTSPGVTDYAKFNSLPRSSRTHQRRTMAWLANQDDNRELEPHSLLLQERQASSPETEPISPLPRYSTRYSAKDDPYDNNHNQYSSVSEGGVSPHNMNVFQKKRQGVGHMNISVERHTLVTGLQPFDMSSPSNNNNERVNSYKDVLVTELEEKVRNTPKSLVLDTPPSSKSSEEASKPGAGWESKTAFLQHEEEEDDSTVSSTTCDTPLPLDPSLCGNKPMFHVLDCTETDCSVMLDFSELESSPVFREGMGFDPRLPGNFRFPRDPSSLSSNIESTSTNDQSMSTEDPPGPVLCSLALETQSGSCDEPESDSVNQSDDKKVDEKAVQTCSPKPASRNKASSKAQNLGRGRSPRTLTSSETQTMRKVVPITKVNRSFSGTRKVERQPSGHESFETRRPLRDQSTPSRRGVEKTPRPARPSSLPPADSSGGRGNMPCCSMTRWARDLTPRGSSRKPNAKPLRNVPKPAPEEKMCRSAMRALAQAQAAADESISQASSSGSKLLSTLPSFARNTIAFSSRTKKEASVPSSPATPVRSATLGRSGSQKAMGSAKGDAFGGSQTSQAEEKSSSSLRRVQSVRASSRSTQRSDTPPPPPSRERSRKSSNFSEKSVLSSMSSKTPWK